MALPPKTATTAAMFKIAENVVLFMTLSCAWRLQVKFGGVGSTGAFSADTPKPEVARGRIHRFRMARGRAVAAAVIRRAQMRAAFDDLAGDFDLRLAGVEAVFFAA